MLKISQFSILALAASAIFPAFLPTYGQTTQVVQKRKTPAQISSQKQKIKPELELWFGVLTTPVREFRFVVELEFNAGATAGNLRSLDEGNQTFALANVSRADGKFSFTLPLTNATYQSTLTNNGTESTGIWMQREQELPLSFEKVAAVPKQKIRNYLTGTLNAIVQKIEVAFIELECGKLYFNSVSQKAGGFIASKEINDEGQVIFRVPGIQGVFQGRYSDDQNDRLQGTWSQGLVTLELTLTKDENISEFLIPTQKNKPNRPQTPNAPFPYTTEQVEIATHDQNVTLAGTLTLPQGEPMAGIILVTGSGPQDRDETILAHKPFFVIADHFARNGIATLRYDDRGVAQSSGNFANATSNDLANDAEAAFNFLSRRQELMGVSLGICGHSEGGLLAPMIAARNTGVNFVILMAAPGVDGKAVILSQGPLLMRAQGVPEPQIAKQRKLQEIILTTIRDNEKLDGGRIAAQVRDALGEEQADLEQIIQNTQTAIRQQASPWLRTFLKLDPKQALSALECPVLAINGTKDLQVDAVLNLTAIRDTLQAAGNTDVEVNLYPGLNHLFQASKTGLPTEYGTLEETFNQAPLRRMTSWILEQAAKQ